MGLDKGILHGKEKRKPYHGAKAIDKSCRNHGSDDWMVENRLYSSIRKILGMKQDVKEYMKGEESDDEIPN